MLTWRPESRSTSAISRCSIAFWKALRVLLHDRCPLELDHRLLDVGVDAAHDAGEQIVAEQQGLGGHRVAVVVALVQRDHRVGDGGEQRIAGQGRVGAGMAAFSLVLRWVARARRRARPDVRFDLSVAPTRYDLRSRASSSAVAL